MILPGTVALVASQSTMDGPGRAPQLPRGSSRTLRVIAHPAGHRGPAGRMRSGLPVAPRRGGDRGREVVTDAELARDLARPQPLLFVEQREPLLRSGPPR